MFDYHSQIDDYLSGKLSGEDLNRFEEQMAIDSDLRNIVKNHDIYKRIADGIIDKGISENIIKVRKRNRSKYFIARVTLFLVAVAVSIWSYVLYSKENKSKMGKKIFVEYYFSPDDTQRGGDGQKEVEDNCIKGHAYLEINKIDKAKAILKEDVEKGNKNCKHKSLYLLSLLSIQENEFDTARKYLNLILNGEQNDYTVKAEELLDRISEPNLTK